MSNAVDETSYRVDGVTYRKGVMSKADDETSNHVVGVTYREDVMSNATDKTSYRAGQVLFLSLIPLHKFLGPPDTNSVLWSLAFNSLVNWSR